MTQEEIKEITEKLLQEPEMYEVTYNRSKGEIYVDRYDKVSNTLYKLEDL